MSRLNNMCKMALVVFCVSYMADTSIFTVIKDQLMSDVEHVNYSQDDYYESMYGDFESMVEERRQRDRIMIGVQAQSDEDYTDIPGIVIRKSYGRKGVRETLTESQVKMNDLAMKFAMQEDGHKNYTGRDNYANGFVEEYYDSQICTR